MERRRCISCDRSVNRSNNRLRRSSVLAPEYVEQHPFIMNYLSEVRNIRQIAEGDRLCRACFQRAQRYIQHRDLPERMHGNENITDVADQEIQPLQEAGEQLRAQTSQNILKISVPGFSRAPYNTHLCIFQSCENHNLQRINKHLRAVILQEHSFYIPLGARVCEEHRLDHAWNDITQVVRHVYTLFSSRQISDMLRLLQKKKAEFLNFERLSSIRDDLFQYYIGFSKAQFTQILQNTPSITRHNEKKPATALATLLAKLHTGEPNERLCKLFKMSRATFEGKMKSVREDLMLEFVPRYIGYDHITRVEVISRCLAIPNALFGGQEEEEERRAITILDGTYIYLQRSTNYYFQRKSYSLHKWRQLYKPFLIVCPDGHIIDIIGPYDATTSDATILNEMLHRRQDPINRFFETNDVFILDRGFRDAVQAMENAGFTVKMPITQSTRGSQLSAQEANESRKVTMCRWVVETINGRLKNQFKLLRHTANNRALGHLFEEIKIASALLNAFGRPLTDHRLVAEILREIRERSHSENNLGDYIIRRNMNARTAAFREITANDLGIDDFPVLTIDDLIVYALGTYQLKQARSYYGEHIKDDGSYKIHVFRELNIRNLGRNNIHVTSPWLLRGRIQSRHRQSRKYYSYILIDAASEGRQAIHAHYCSCIVGKRTLGCCSHIMSIIWYLSWGRYQPNLTPPAILLDNIIIRHDVENEAEESSDEEEEQ